MKPSLFWCAPADRSHLSGRLSAKAGRTDDPVPAWLGNATAVRI